VATLRDIDERYQALLEMGENGILDQQTTAALDPLYFAIHRLERRTVEQQIDHDTHERKTQQADNPLLEAI